MNEYSPIATTSSNSFPPIDFVIDLTGVINKYSKENGSNTPDFILAGYLRDCLDSFDRAFTLRSSWYNGNQQAAPAPEAPAAPEPVPPMEKNPCGCVDTLHAKVCRLTDELADADAAIKRYVDLLSEKSYQIRKLETEKQSNKNHYGDTMAELLAAKERIKQLEDITAAAVLARDQTDAVRMTQVEINDSLHNEIRREKEATGYWKDLFSAEGDAHKADVKRYNDLEKLFEQLSTHHEEQKTQLTDALVTIREQKEHIAIYKNRVTVLDKEVADLAEKLDASKRSDTGWKNLYHSYKADLAEAEIRIKTLEQDRDTLNNLANELREQAAKKDVEVAELKKDVDGLSRELAAAKEGRNKAEEAWNAAVKARPGNSDELRGAYQRIYLLEARLKTAGEQLYNLRCDAGEMNKALMDGANDIERLRDQLVSCEKERDEALRYNIGVIDELSQARVAYANILREKTDLEANLGFYARYIVKLSTACVTEPAEYMIEKILGHEDCYQITKNGKAWDAPFYGLKRVREWAYIRGYPIHTDSPIKLTDFPEGAC